MISREIRIILKEWIALWQSVQGESNNKICSVYGTFWNVPEGCVSVVFEHSNAGSLENLLESVGAIPEKVLLEITKHFIPCLQEIQRNLELPYGCIAPSQVLFNQDGEIKLGLGIANRLSLCQKEPIGSSITHHTEIGRAHV